MSVYYTIQIITLYIIFIYTRLQLIIVINCFIYFTLTLMLSINFTILNPLLGKCTLIDPVLAAGAIAAPLPLSAISVDLADGSSSAGVLLP